MSRPPNNTFSNSNVYNGGLIDFQDASRVPLATDQSFGAPQVANTFGAPPVANMAAYTLQSSYPMYTQNQMPNPNPNSFYPNTALPAIAPQNVMQQRFPMHAMTQAQVLVGPPSEVYAHGRVYKAVDEALINSPAIPVPTTASLVVEQVSDRDINRRVEEKVQECMSRINKKVGLSTRSKSSSSTSDAFVTELRKINKGMKSKS
jgi:hypothetical protein